METFIVIIAWVMAELWFAYKKWKLKRKEEKIQKELSLYWADYLEELRNRKPLPKVDYSDFEKKPSKE